LTLISLLSALLLAQSPDPLAEAHRALADFDLATAESLGAKALAQSPGSPAVHNFLGELHLSQGHISASEKELKKAIELDEKFSRAWYELSRVYDLASLHHRAELCLVQAHELAPKDETYEAALAVLRRPRQHPGEARLTSEYFHAEIPFGVLMSDGRHIRAFSLPVSINGGKPLRLMIDTGAGGILLRTKAAERAGLRKITDTKIGGIGDKGKRDGWVSQADRVQIGNVAFADYPVEVTDKDALSDEDGLIGTDVFADFMVTLDFFNRKLLLDPLPGANPDRTRTFDRTITSELKDFSPIFRLGHTLLIQTKINDTDPVLFVIDTGSTTSLIAKKVAKAATKVYSDDNTVMKGLSGKVREVSRTNELIIQFANFKQRNQEMVAFDFDGVSRGYSIDIGGVLGLPLLNMFRSVTIDYRDGLIKFVYKDH
jgi:predicted aspartyl protease